MADINVSVAPRWTVALEDALASAATGVILTGNTGDRVHLAHQAGEISGLVEALGTMYARRGYRVGVYRNSSGFEELLPPSTPRGTRTASPFSDVPTGPSDASLVLPPLTHALQQSSARVMLIVDYADHLVPSAPGSPASLTPAQVTSLQTVHRWGQDDLIRRSGNAVVLVSYEDAVHHGLVASGGWSSVAVDLPDSAAREQFVTALLGFRSAGHADRIGTLEPGYTATEHARQASGLRLLDIERLLLQSGATKKPVTRDRVRNAKQAAIRQVSRGLLEVVEPTAGFESVAGAQHAKAFFNGLRNHWRTGSTSCPGSVLLAGVPGCGKSHLVKAIAHELGAPLLVMRGVRDPYVGQSERNLDHVLWIIDNLQPAILWTDELDQNVGQRSTGSSNDSGTNERMLARVFEYFGSLQHRGRLLWIGTTNRPDVLDPALLDRFGVCIPFLHPSASERAELLPLLAAQVGRELAADVDVRSVADNQKIDLLTVRSLQEIVAHAGLRADRRSGGVGVPVSGSDLLWAIDDFKPTYDAEEHEFIALKALEMTSFRSLQPWTVTERGSQTECPSYVRRLLDSTTGEFDSNALRDRLNELEHNRAQRKAMR